METLVIALFWLICLLAFLKGQRALLYLFFASIAFGTLAVVPPALTGGLTIIPVPVAALLLALRTFTSAKGLSRLIGAAFRLNPLAVLALFWSMAVLATLFMPRVFAGTIMVVPMRANEAGTSPLSPTMQNVSQLIYLTISVVAVFTFAEILKSRSMRRTAMNALVFGSGVMLFTGVLDLLTEYLPLGPFLELFRTATYALLVDVKVLTMKRVVGLMPEASSFGATCVILMAMLYFFRRAVPPEGRLRRVVPLVALLLGVFAFLSTSSAAFLGLGILFVLAVLEWCVRFFTLPTASGRRGALSTEATVFLASLLAITLVLLLWPRAFDGLLRLLDELLVKKTDSDSFEERSMWTAVAWQSVVDSYGLGVGVGSARASNFWAALTSNVGVLGASFYIVFLVACYARRPSEGAWGDRLMLSACRWSLVPNFIMGSIVGTTADFGTLSAFSYGLMIALGSQGRAERAAMRSSYVSDRPIPPAAVPVG